MFKVRKIKLFRSFIFVMIFLLIFLSSSIATGEVDSFSEIQEKLTGISEEEREIIKNLFLLLQEIEEMENEEIATLKEIEIIKQEIYSLEEMIIKEEIAYEDRKNVLKNVLKSYQRRGAGSFLEIILTSDDLSTLLRRINTLRDLTRNTGDLLEKLEESREKLATEKEKLDEKLISIEEKQQKLQISLEKKLQSKENMEKYLASLESEREHYQEYLENIQQVWDEIKIVFAKSTKEFARIIEGDNLPTDSLKLSFTLFNVKGVIDEKTINDVISEHSTIEEMIISFHPGRIQVEMPNKHIKMSGIFDIIDGHTLRFIAKEGSFYGMPLTTSAMDELFKDNYLILNLKSLLYGNTLHSVEILEGYLELTSRLTLF